MGGGGGGLGGGGGGGGGCRLIVWSGESVSICVFDRCLQVTMLLTIFH